MQPEQAHAAAEHAALKLLVACALRSCFLAEAGAAGGVLGAIHLHQQPSWLNNNVHWLLGHRQQPVLLYSTAAGAQQAVQQRHCCLLPHADAAPAAAV